jgi:serine protease Do
MLKNSIYRSLMAAGMFAFAASFLLLNQDARGAQEKSAKGWLGVSVRELTPSMRDDYQVGNRTGLLIVDVVRNSPADDAGLREDDVILKYAGQAVEKTDEFSNLVLETEPGKKVKILILRDGEEKEFEAEIAKRRAVKKRAFHWSGRRFEIPIGRPLLGVQVQELNEDLAPYFNVAKNSGVLITEVSEDSPAEKAGLKAGDVITKINDSKIADHRDLIETLEDYEEGEAVTIEYVRKGKTETTEVELEGSELPEIHIGGPHRDQIRILRFNDDPSGFPHHPMPPIIMDELLVQQDSI